MNKLIFFSAKLAIAVIISSNVSAQGTNSDIPKPLSISIDKGLSSAQAKAAKDATLNFYAFWNTGKTVYMQRSVSADFFDNTLPAGRPQGIKGLIYAQERIRKAIPDIKCILKDVIISGDKVTARMIFTGTHKGEFMGKPATGKKIEFLAIDILHIKNGKIFEDWHLEDNLSFLRQIGVVK